MFELIIITIIAAINFFIGLAVFLKNPKSSAHRSLTALSFTASIWSVIVVLENVLKNQGKVVFLDKIDFTLGPFIVYFLLLFSLNFGKDAPILPKLLVLIPTLFFSALSLFTDAVVHHLEFESGRPLIFRGFLHPLFAFYFYFYAIASFVILISKYRKFFGIKKAQLFYINLGMAGCAIFWAVGSTISLYFTHFQFGVLGEISRISIFGIFIATIAASLAILRHRFMDIKVALRRGTITFVLLFFVFALYTYFILFSQRKSEEIFGITPLLSTFFAVIVISLSFQPLYLLFQKFAQRFIKEKYNFEKISVELEKNFSQQFHLENLSFAFIPKLKEIFKVENVYFFIAKDGVFQQILPKEKGLALENSQLFSDYFQENKQILITEEIPYLIEERQLPLIFYPARGVWQFLEREKQKKEKLKNIEKILQEQEISILLPLSFDSKLSGCLLFGPKKSKEIFSRQEIQFLESLKEKLSLALQNILFYQQTIERIKKD